MKTVNVHEAKTNLSGILAEVETTGENFVVCRNGKPVAQLSPYRPGHRLRPHPLLRKVRLKYDPTEPLTEAEWPERP